MALAEEDEPVERDGEGDQTNQLRPSSTKGKRSRAVPQEEKATWFEEEEEEGGGEGTLAGSGSSSSNVERRRKRGRAFPSSFQRSRYCVNTVGTHSARNVFRGLLLPHPKEWTDARASPWSEIMRGEGRGGLLKVMLHQHGNEG